MAGNSNVVQIKFEGIANFSNVLNNIKSVRSALQNIKMPEKLSNSLEKNINQTITSIEKLQAQSKKGFSKPGDVSAYEKELNKADIAINKIVKDLSKLSSKELIDLNIDTTKIIQLKQEIKDIKAQLATNVKGAMLDPSTGLKSSFSGMEQILNKGTRAKAIYDQLINSINKGNFSQANTEWEKLQGHMERYSKGKMDTSQWKAFQTAIVSAFAAAGVEVDKLTPKLEKADQELNEALNVESSNAANYMQQLENGVQGTAAGFGALADKERQAANEMLTMNQQMNQLKTQANYFFSLQNIFQLLKRGIRDAVDTIKELDASMTETAVVTEFSVEDMWGMLPEYTKAANELGSTINDVYQAATLYYQQGLDTNQAMGLANETLKMARIGGLEAAQATDMMTAALRGFNMEINEASGQRINDVYSNLAAKTASNTRELGDAMTRTASIAHSANMSFEMTSAFLANMIETTREAPENLGTAMKTIVARFQEMKMNPGEIVDVEGEEVDFNRVDKALKTIGVELTESKDKFRDLDDVFMDISEKWDSLTQTQQRYIATIAAGSRQQSRFIAMVGDYKRMQELATYANDAAGASNIQFSKTLDSMAAKTNQFKNAWDQFIMGITNNKLIKGVIDFGTTFIGWVNKLINALSGGNGIIKSILSLGAAFTGLKIGGKIINSLLGGLGKMVDPSSKGGFLSGLAGGATGNKAAANVHQAKMISDPIVGVLNKILNVMPTKQNVQAANNKEIVGLTQEAFKRANSNINDQLRGIIRGTDENGKQIVAEKVKTFEMKGVVSQMTGMDSMQQSLVMKNNPALQKIMKDGVFSMLGGNQKGISTKDQIKFKAWTNSLAQYAATSGTNLELSDLLLPNNRQSQRRIVEGLINTSKEAADIYKKQYEKVQESITSKNKGFAKLDEDRQKEILKNAALKKTGKELGLNYGINLDPKEITKTNQMTQAMGKLSSSAMGAGMAFQQMGMTLSNMGLGTFGGVVSGIGTAFMSLGGAISGVAQALEVIHLGPLLGITAAIGLIVGVVTIWKKQQQKIHDDAQKVVEDYKKISDETSRNLSTLEDYRESWEKLSRGVDANGNNVSLGAEEYQDYQKMVDEMVSMNPDIIKGYNAQGKAIVDNNKALEESVKLEKEKQQAAIDTYTSEKSLNKLITERNTNKDYNKNNGEQITTGNFGFASTNSRYSNIVKQDDESLANKFLKSDKTDIQKYADQFSDAFKNVEGADEFFNKWHIDLDNIDSHGQQVLNNYGSYIMEQAKQQFTSSEDVENLEKAQEALGQFGDSYAAYEDSISDIYDSLVAFSADRGLTDLVDPSLLASYNQGIKTIAGSDLNANQMQTSVEKLNASFSTMNGHVIEYKSIMAEVEKAQDNFASNLDEEAYINSDAIQNAKDKLEDWAHECELLYEHTGEVQYQAMAETFRNQSDVIENFASTSLPTLEEAFDTLSGHISAANQAYESFSKSIEGGDYYTAADNLGKIYEEIRDGVDDMGRGSQSYWKGAKYMVSESLINEHDVDKVANQMDRLKKFYTEGPKGTQLWFADLKNKIQSGFMKDKDIDQYIKLAKNGNIEFNMDDISSEEFHRIAEALGMSEDSFTALLNKARQFTDLTFASPTMIREALYGDENVKQIGEGENAKFIATRDYLESAAEATGQSLEDLTDSLDEANVTILENADKYLVDKDKSGKLNKAEKQEGVKQWMDALGIKLNKKGTISGKRLIDESIGYASQEDIEKMFKASVESGLITNAETSDFNELYTQALQEKENPVENDINNNVSDIASNVSLISKLLAVEQGAWYEGQEGSGQKAIDKLNDKEGWQQKFAQGKDENGNYLTNSKYEKLKKKAQEDREAAIEEQSFLEAQIKNAKTEKDKKGFREELKAWKEAEKISDDILNEAEKSHNRNKGLETKLEETNAPEFTTEQRNVIVKTQLDTSQDLTDALGSLTGEKGLNGLGKDKTTNILIDIATQVEKGAGVDELKYDFKKLVIDPETGEGKELYEKIKFIVDNKDPEAKFKKIKKEKKEVSKPETIELKAKDLVTDVADNAAAAVKNLGTEHTVTFKAIDKTQEQVTKILNKIAQIAVKAAQIKIGNMLATGQNNFIPHQTIPTIGSLAGGNTKKFNHGTVGPNDNGGLTLTGEKGFEIAWLPSENRSMILGAKGPQLVDLPSDAVVWTNQQSKKIIKQKAIPMGSNETGKGGSNVDWDRAGGGGSKKSSSKKSSSNSSDKKKTKEKEKELIKRGKLSVYVYNMEKKIEQVERQIEKTQKAINKALEKASTTLKDITKDGNKYISYLNKEVALNKQLSSYYTKLLKNLDKNNKKSRTTIEWSNETQKYKKENGKWKKNGKGTKKHKQQINIGKYIKQDPDTGAYVIDQAAINKVAKKDKNKAKAIRDKAKEKIDKYTSGRNTAEDKIADAQDKLDEFAKQLYDTFYGWENELTKVFNLTQQITNLQQKREKANKFLEMRSALLSSGMRQASNEFIKESLDIYKAQLGIQLKEIQKREQLISAAQEKISKLQSTKDEKDRKTEIQKRLSQGASYAKKQNEVNKAQKKVDKANKTVKTYNTNRKKAKEMKDDVLSTKTKKKLQNKIDKLEKKKKDGKLTKKEKQELKNAKAKLSADKKTRNFLKKNSTKALTLKNYKQAKKEVKDQKKLQKQKEKAEAVIAKLSKKKNLTKTEKADLKKAKENLKNAKAGLAKNAKAQKIIKAYEAQQSLSNLNTKLQTAKTTLSKASGSLSATEKLALEEEKRQLEEQIKNTNTAKKYIKTSTNEDGSINIDIDSEQLEKDKKAGKISEELYNFIKQYYDDLEEANSELTEAYEAQLEAVEEMASTLRDLQEAYADRSEELLQALEEQNQKEIDRLKKLSDALDKALKELLDEVKKRLEQRRQQEDNAKTEEDIAQKQQRLAALRADSSGGNAVKIKQLEKEIADAQQSYTRTLEDQTLQRMQDEADEAAKQRERQIELLEAQLEYQKATGVLAAQVNEWLSDPDKYMDTITKVWMKNQDLAEKTAARLVTIQNDFQLFLSDIAKDGLPAKIDIQSTTLNNALDELKNLETIKNTLLEMAGLKQKEEKEEEEDNGNSGGGSPTSGDTPITGNSTKDLEEAAEKKNKAKQDYLQFLTNHGSKLSTSKKKGKLTKDDLKKQIERGKELGYSTRTVLQHLANQDMLSWATVLKAYIGYRGGKTKAEKSIREWWGKNPSAARKSGFKSAFGKAYAKGGLATSTGPAWLDGTKSKPELVLNAQDTKNFLALKDTLSKAVSGTSNIVGDTNMTYDIDINVDHIANDYDVDQIANRVQKKIVQSANYRNVNAIRNIR